MMLDSQSERQTKEIGKNRHSYLKIIQLLKESRWIKEETTAIRRHGLILRFGVTMNNFFQTTFSTTPLLLTNAFLDS